MTDDIKVVSAETVNENPVTASIRFTQVDDGSLVNVAIVLSHTEEDLGLTKGDQAPMVYSLASHFYDVIHDALVIDDDEQRDEFLAGRAIQMDDPSRKTH